MFKKVLTTFVFLFCFLLTLKASYIPSNEITNISTSTITNAFYYQNKPVQGMWGSMKNPWIVQYELTYVANGSNAVAGGVMGESAVLTNLLLMKASGDFANITNNGQLAFYFDGVSFNGRLSIQGANLTNNWSYITNNYGTMLCNSNFFPHGWPWLNSVLHSNNIKSIVQIYEINQPILPGADAWACNGAGSVRLAFTNSYGWPSNYADGSYEVMTSPDTAKSDISQLAKWGFDGFVLADAFQSYQDFLNLDVEYGNDALRISVPYYPNVGAYNPDTPMLQTIGKNLNYFVYQTINSVQNYTLGSLTRQNHNGVYYENSNQGSGANGMTNIMRDFSTTKYAYEGSYVFWWDSANNDGAFVALTHGLPIHCFTNYVFSSFSYNYGYNLQMVTNKLWGSIWNDSLQAWPTIFYQQDTPTNQSLVAYEKLSDGSVALAIANTSGNNYNTTINFNQIGFPTNQVMAVSNAFNGFLVNGEGIYSNSVALINFSYSSSLFRLTPIPTITIPSVITTTLSSNSSIRLPALFNNIGYTGLSGYLMTNLDDGNQDAYFPGPIGYSAASTKYVKNALNGYLNSSSSLSSSLLSSGTNNSTIGVSNLTVLNQINLTYPSTNPPAVIYSSGSPGNPSIVLSARTGAPQFNSDNYIDSVGTNTISMRANSGQLVSVNQNFNSQKTITAGLNVSTNGYILVPVPTNTLANIGSTNLPFLWSQTNAANIPAISASYYDANSNLQNAPFSGLTVNGAQTNNGNLTVNGNVKITGFPQLATFYYIVGNYNAGATTIPYLSGNLLNDSGVSFTSPIFTKVTATNGFVSTSNTWATAYTSATNAIWAQPGAAIFGVNSNGSSTLWKIWSTNDGIGKTFYTFPQ